MAIASEPIQKAIVMITAQPVTAAVQSEETIAIGTAFAAFEASSAIVADDSNPETTHTGVRKHIMNAHPSLVQNPVFWKSEKTKLALFFNSLGVPAAKEIMSARSIASCTKMYVILSLCSVSELTHVMPKVRKVVAANMP